TQQQDETESTGDQGFPEVRFHDAAFAVATGTNELGVVRLLTPESTVTRGPEAWVFAGAGDVELDGSYPLTFQIEAVPSNEWAHVQATFGAPITQVIPGYGTVSVRTVDIAGTPTQLTGSVRDISVEPARRFGVDAVSVEEIDVSLRAGNQGWVADSLRVVRPTAKLSLRG